MEIDKDLLWLQPYLKKAIKIEPKTAFLRKIKSIKRRGHGRDRTYGEIVFDSNKNITIKLRTDYQYIHFNPLKVKIEKLSKIDVIHLLAHEIAHLRYFNHCTNHKILECKLMIEFMKILQKEGYTSDEEEMNQIY